MKQLPELTGSEKQIAWALDIRKKFIERMTTLHSYYTDDYVETLEIDPNCKGMPRIKEAPKMIMEYLDYIISNKTEAKWYIEARDDLRRLLVIYIVNNHPSSPLNRIDFIGYQYHEKHIYELLTKENKDKYEQKTLNRLTNLLK